MTIVGAWVRTSKRGAQELVVCSDSRLSNAANLDCSPKIFQLPRSGTVLAFSGDTYIAYPLLLQMSHAINSHAPAKNGAMDHVILKSYLIKLANELFSRYETDFSELKKTDSNFLLCGYSWFRKEFMIDRFYYSETSKKFEHQGCGKGMGKFGKFSFIGDVRKKATINLQSLLRERHGYESLAKEGNSKKRFDMEPFEVIRDMIRASGKDDSIGGAPQLVTIGQHMISKHVGVFWPNKESNKRYVNGRPVFDFESIDNWILDPDTLKKHHQHFQPTDQEQTYTPAHTSSPELEFE